MPTRAPPVQHKAVVDPAGPGLHVKPLMSAPPETATLPATPVRTIFWLAAAAFASSAAVRVADPLLPPIAAEFGTSIGMASNIATAYSVAYGLFQLLYGPLGDRLGKLRIIVVATIGASLATFGCIFAPSMDVLILLRFMAGGLAAGLIPLSLAFIGDSVPYEKRQAVIARFILATTLGLVFGQIVGGFLAEYLSWRAVFGVLAAFFMVAAIGIRREVGPLRALAPPTSSQTFLAAYRHLFSLLRLGRVQAVLAAVFSEGLFLFGSLTFVGSHVHQVFGLGLDRIGLILALFGFGGVTYSIAAPLFIRMLGEQGLMLVGGLVLGGSFLASALANSATWFIVIAPCIGLGAVMLHNTLQTKATQMSPQSRGSALAWFASCFYLGQTTGVGLAGLSFDQWGAVPGFVVSALGLPLLGLAFAVYLRKAR